MTQHSSQPFLQVNRWASKSRGLPCLSSIATSHQSTTYLPNLSTFNNPFMVSTSAVISNGTTLLFKLPLELRQIVYSYVFASSTFRLINQGTGKKGMTTYALSTPVSKATSLLTTCHVIHDEATLYFYLAARIHFSVRSNPKVTVEPLQVHLPHLRHLSLDFSCHAIDREIDREKFGSTLPEAGKRVATAADKALGKCIDTIAQTCPCLQTLSLYLVSKCPDYAGPYGPYQDDRDFLQSALTLPAYRTRYTIEALRNLRVRDTIVVVAAGIHDDYEDLHGAIAPYEDWDKRACKEWPGMTLSHKALDAIKNVLFPSIYNGVYGDKDVWMWFSQPTGSKALILPEHEVIDWEKCPCAYALDSEEESNESSNDEDEHDGHPETEGERILRLLWERIQEKR